MFRRIVNHNLVIGNIMQIWDFIEFSLARASNLRKIQVLRCRDDTAKVYVGLDLPQDAVSILAEKLRNKNTFTLPVHQNISSFSGKTVLGSRSTNLENNGSKVPLATSKLENSLN
mmetsp:Transcript_3786/g.5170  ORF Transcript_3786/g.5170 Transcript_3786/m.5170 type:complete len:115 (+) Transcript_3786:94-438(+)